MFVAAPVRAWILSAAMAGQDTGSQMASRFASPPDSARPWVYWFWSEGNITRVDVRDPSFVNWTVVGHSGKGNIVPDFPLINKSFNLSYCGHDL